MPDYLISTPENVDLHLELAGFGNRVLAAFVDRLLIGFATVLTIVACVIVGLVMDHSAIPHDAKTIFYYYLIGLGLFVIFLINFGYFIYFEGTWQGQTPGKRLVGIRVIEANGQPASWAAVFIRNLLRIVDEGLFFIGVLSMMVDRNERRFGDLAAGTLVIKERLQSLSTKDLKITATAPAEGFIDAGQISPDEYQMLLTFLKRREIMSVSQRPRLAVNLADYFRRKLNVFNDGDAPESFLEKLYLAYAARAQPAAE